MSRMECLNREQVDRLADLLLNMCLHFTEVQYTESILRARGFGDTELAALGFDVSSEWAEMDSCVEV